MGKNVNLWLSNYQSTGSSVNFPQYEVDVAIDWIDNSGSKKSASQIVQFPNILSASELSNQWLKKKLTHLMIDALREIEGVDL